MKRPKVVIIGAGPAGLMAATRLKDLPVDIVLVDQKTAVARKFLVAGDGGFNLTHSEELPAFLEKYDRSFIRDCVTGYTPDQFREWLAAIGIETFIGSSGKVFPVTGIKPIQVLKAWLKQLEVPNISFKLKTKLVSFDARKVTLQTGKIPETIAYDYLVLAMGGASWKKTGSDGKWLDILDRQKVPVLPFGASNSGVELYPREWLTKHEGAILKNIRLTAGGTTIPGDLVVTAYGLEGKPVYAANRWLRAHDFKGLKIDFKPQLSTDHLISVFHKAKKVRDAFDKLKIPVVVYEWIKEEVSKADFLDAVQLAKRIKAFEPKIKGLRPIDEVISTVGGIDMDAIDEKGRLTGYKNVYCCGEMLDWDAPTGGYLLQACVSSGFVVGTTIRDQIS